jgi:hypothetical protein
MVSSLSAVKFTGLSYGKERKQLSATCIGAPNPPAGVPSLPSSVWWTVWLYLASTTELKCVVAESIEAKTQLLKFKPPYVIHA